MQGSKKAWLATALLVALAIAAVLLSGCASLAFDPRLSYDLKDNRLDFSFIRQK